ncbi:hypothetical protein ANN_00385 [Periplaneta americana]|uniref:Uncharacterized protein n=1 Tax=Periplaneta americana TaxID=6978 RepID=A0ABQ8TQM3_PERAM|nr:hypothetical protein ANN_00385 [Periplaneta americana]
MSYMEELDQRRLSQERSTWTCCSCKSFPGYSFNKMVLHPTGRWMSGAHSRVLDRARWTPELDSTFS